MPNARDMAMRRSGGRCEAMVYVHTQWNGKVVWTRCFAEPVEVHHALTRARGGKILDGIGEYGHLICLCSKHHRLADGEDAYRGGMLMDGYVTVENGKVVYYGNDEYLREWRRTEKYGKPDEVDEGEGSADHDAAGAVAEDAGPSAEVEPEVSGVRGQGTLW